MQRFNIHLFYVVFQTTVQPINILTGVCFALLNRYDLEKIGSKRNPIQRGTNPEQSDAQSSVLKRFGFVINR